METYADAGKRGGVHWVKVSEEVGTHSAMQCSVYYEHTLKPRLRNMVGGPWSEEEDERLRAAVTRFEGQGVLGGIDWTAVSEEMSTRNMLQCRNRWTQTLKPQQSGVNTGPWSDEEV